MIVSSEGYFHQSRARFESDWSVGDVFSSDVDAEEYCACDGEEDAVRGELWHGFSKTGFAARPPGEVGSGGIASV